MNLIWDGKTIQFPFQRLHGGIQSKTSQIKLPLNPNILNHNPILCQQFQLSYSSDIPLMMTVGKTFNPSPNFTIFIGGINHCQIGGLFLFYPCYPFFGEFVGKIRENDGKFMDHTILHALTQPRDHWIGLRENLEEPPIFIGRIPLGGSMIDNP